MNQISGLVDSVNSVVSLGLFLCHPVNAGDMDHLIFFNMFFNIFGNYSWSSLGICYSGVCSRVSAALQQHACRPSLLLSF